MTETEEARSELQRMRGALEAAREAREAAGSAGGGAAHAVEVRLATVRRLYIAASIYIYV